MASAARLEPELVELIKALARADAEDEIARRFGRRGNDEARRDIRPLQQR